MVTQAEALDVRERLRELKSLHDEGCDMSVTSAQKTAHAALAPASHWWWKFEPPIFCSAGCPLIQPLRIS